MSHFLWLASYPKSGNTWLRIFLTNLQQPDKRPIHINDLSPDSFFIASNRMIFDQFSPVSAANLSFNEIYDLLPSIYRQLALYSTPPILTKIHHALIPTSKDKPLIPKELTKGIIYIVRNPLDIAPSLANHFNFSLDEAVHMLCNESASISSNRYRLQNQLFTPLLSWQSHVSSWIDHPDFTVHLVRYEDMHQQPVKTFSAIANYINAQYSKQDILDSINASSFTRLKQQELADGFLEQAQLNTPFFRQGKTGQGKKNLSATQMKQIVAINGDLMTRLGYLV